jgi:hypothetical protein
LKFLGLFSLFSDSFFAREELSRSQTCEFAPDCPDLASWKAGFVCDDGLMPDIRTRVIDGFVRKMICCKGECYWMR